MIQRPRPAPSRALADILDQGDRQPKFPSDIGHGITLHIDKRGLPRQLLPSRGTVDKDITRSQHRPGNLQVDGCPGMKSGQIIDRPVIKIVLKHPTDDMGTDQATSKRPRRT